LNTSAQPLSVLVLQGDAEASLLAGAGPFLQGLFPHRAVDWCSAWSPRVDQLAAGGTPVPEALRRAGLLPALDPGALLEARRDLVIVPILPSVAMPFLRHRSGGAFLAHRGLRAAWSPADAAAVAAECTELPPLSPAEAASALEPTIVALQERGAAVVVCNAFRRVREPLAHRRPDGPPSLRELVRSTNLEIARLSQRTGCFVLDLDRPLAQQGGAELDADCFGGADAAGEIALDELVGVLFDVMPEVGIPPPPPAEEA
jgi:hypothetical protein